MWLSFHTQEITCPLKRVNSSSGFAICQFSVSAAYNACYVTPPRAVCFAPESGGHIWQGRDRTRAGRFRALFYAVRGPAAARGPAWGNAGCQNVRRPRRLVPAAAGFVHRAGDLYKAG